MKPTGKSDIHGLPSNPESAVLCRPNREAATTLLQHSRKTITGAELSSFSLR